MEAKLSSLFVFPEHVYKVSHDPTSPRTRISTTYILRGVMVDSQLTFFSQWTRSPNPYKQILTWYKADFSPRGYPEIGEVEESEVLSVARDRGRDGVMTVYVRDDVPQDLDKVFAPEYLRVRTHFARLLTEGIHTKG